jgi:hypothetical protein
MHPKLLVATCWVAYITHQALLPQDFLRACKLPTESSAVGTDLCTLHTLNTMGTWALSQEESVASV